MTTDSEGPRPPVRSAASADNFARDRAYNPAPEFLPPKPVRRRLAVFGGSFNPVHNGHLFLAGHIVRAGLADEVLFVPTGIPPHKTSEDLAAGEHRYSLLRAALLPYREFSVSDIEVQRQDRPSYTIETMETLRLAFPEDDLIFLMGLDCLLELHTWHRATQLVNDYAFLVYPRPGFIPPKLVTLADSFGTRNAQKLLRAVIDAPLLPLKASEIRAFCAAGKTLAGLVPDPVRTYIIKNRLYGARGTTTE